MRFLGFNILKDATYAKALEDAYHAGIIAERNSHVQCSRCIHAKPSKSKEGMLTCYKCSRTVSPSFYCADGVEA